MRNTIAKAKPERDIARAEGRKTYCTGRACKHGHIAPRNTADASCTACRAAFSETYRQEARDYAQRRRDEALATDPDGTRAAWSASNRARRERDPEAVRALERKHGRLKRERHPKRKLADTRARQAARQQRTPPWADLAAIKAFYEACPDDMVVDHVIPLRGRTVSGLHVLINLQYLTPAANLAKGNRFDGDLV